MNLLEQYKGRMKVAERVYAQNHNGAQLSESRKLATAVCLNNVAKFINESFTSSVGTQAVSDLGLFKKFAMNLTNVVLPNLIANDIAIVYPMSAASGYLNYIKYTTGNAKSDYEAEETLLSPWEIGKVKNPSFTSSAVVETLDDKGTISWTPVAKLPLNFCTGEEPEGEYYVLDAADNTKYVATQDPETGVWTAPAGAGKKVKYFYNNIVVPQAQLPMLKAKMEMIPLLARARRIAIYYSQIAAFQAKTDYGFDLGDQLAEKAAGQLAYEIDTEVVQAIIDAAGDPKITWKKAVPQYISKAEHYEGFSETVEDAKRLVYDATGKFVPNYMLIASDILPILTFIKGFQAAPAGIINGPYFAGTLNGVKVFVSPALKAGHFVLGVNGDDMMSSAVVYAPYMPIVPTQLLGFADGGMTQGFSTMYDLKVLNKNLVVAGQVVDGENKPEDRVTFINPTVNAGGESI